MKLNKEQIAIIASYWDVECKYEVAVHLDPKRYIREKIYSEGLGTVNCYTLKSFDRYHSFKLILRPLWSITEKELRALSEVLGLKDMEVFLLDSVKVIQLNGSVGSAVIIHEDSSLFFYKDDYEDWVKVINHLRQKGFCVDSQLVEWGLVEWKEMEQ